ncbi:hypothetical protein ACCD10_16795 [Pseudomonas sp. Pseusp122]|uniref:hypothetical protein n=1 Tax=unclassified Pseudomonas TaxID=196821 RepID=UPI0039A422C5
MVKPIALSKLSRVAPAADSELAKVVSRASDIVERNASKALAGSSIPKKPRTVRAPQLSAIERELHELQKVVQALSICSVIHDQETHFVDPYGMTWMDADTAYHLLDNPGEPNEALNEILALR